MKDNTIRDSNGLDLYNNKMDQLLDEYIATLPDETMIYKRKVFSGGLDYIYKHLFKPDRTRQTYNGRSSTIDYSDIFTIEDIYEWYLNTCCRFDKEVSINGFMRLTGISSETLSNWRDNKLIPLENRYSTLIYNKDNIDQYGRVKPNRQEWIAFYHKIHQMSEQSLSESMLDGNLMAYATLKCWYGWKEEPQQLALVQNADIRTPEEIAQRHKNAELPEIPE